MRLQSLSTNEGGARQMTLDLIPGEIRSLRAGLGEVCYGFRLESFEARIGVTKSEAQALFERLDHLSLDHGGRVEVTERELVAVRNAHAETLRKLGAEEYATRTGVGFDDGQRLLHLLDEALKDRGWRRF